MATPELKCTTNFVDLPNGVTLYTERRHLDATPPSTTIVCIHGLGSSSTTFYPIIKPILAALPTAHILAYDWAGSGSSPRPSSTSTSAASRTASSLVADLDTLVAASAPSGPLVVLAHSVGTHLASRWLLLPRTQSAHAPRATHVVYLGGPLNPPLAPAVTRMQLDLAATVAADGPAAVVDGLVPLLLGATSMAERPLAAIQDRAKVLVVLGEEDVLLGRADVTAFVDRAVVRKVASAGHTLTLEAPEETAQAIVEFLLG